MNDHSKNRFRCTATGDAMITRRLPMEGEYEGFSQVRDYIMKGDFRFSNLETTVHNFESYASARSGGSWLCSPPGVLEDIKKFGFNILSTANNHALDYAHDGLVKTLEYLEKANIPYAGTGRNLAASAAPCYIDTVSGRYALIAACMTFNEEAMAGAQSPSLPGRPGLNGIRTVKNYFLPKEELAQLKNIADKLHINAKDDIIRKEGYLPELPPGCVPFTNTMMFKEGPEAKIESHAHPEDMQRTIAGIHEARFMADYVVVAMHNHTISGTTKESVDDLSIEFAHNCIDAGADAVISTGPHLLRPMEIYKGKPIFYCLGDFITQLETFAIAPEDMYAKQKLSSSAGLDVLFNTRSDNGRKGLSYQQVMYESIIPYWEVENGELTKLEFLPVEELFALPRSRGGWPVKNTTNGIIERFAEMCKPFNVDITIDENGIGKVKL